MGTDYSRPGQPLPADQLDAAFASWARADQHLIASVEHALDAGVELDLIRNGRFDDSVRQLLIDDILASIGRRREIQRLLTDAGIDDERAWVDYLGRNVMVRHATPAGHSVDPDSDAARRVAEVVVPALLGAGFVLMSPEGRYTTGHAINQFVAGYGLIVIDAEESLGAPPELEPNVGF
ncbi:hypothetical protein [Nocardia gipuzkoensis]|uniref:hypothetical protein n=1 Tax=Nocardia gipuzkoensis TaxID=2749991 RepID=UPI00237D61AE|nr:hypothetical protein [Nocardia gipuzkoensis]MDE1675074.1 hypothetical protein [Nocardia gipuzkoensis]